jgi:hypothetical protein
MADGVFHRVSQVLFFLIVLAVFASVSTQKVRAAACGSGETDIAVGGTVGFAEMADPNNTTRLRATCRAGLYIHDYIWGRLPNDQAREAILKVFHGTGPEVVEIGATTHIGQYWNQYYTNRFIRLGVKADQAEVDGVYRLTVPEWKLFVDGGRAVGIKVIAPIFSPNGGEWKNAPFDDAKWDDVRTEARYGGGISIDSPPNFFLASQPGYQAFVEDELRWARSSGLQATLIISPNTSGTQFEADTIAAIKKLTADHALPTFYVVENYRPLPVAPGYLNAIGSEDNPISINGVALWVADHASR